MEGFLLTFHHVLLTLGMSVLLVPVAALLVSTFVVLRLTRGEAANERAHAGES